MYGIIVIILEYLIYKLINVDNYSSSCGMNGLIEGKILCNVIN